MRTCKIVLSSLLAVLTLVSCSQKGIVEDNVKVADAQLRSLVEASEAGDTLRIPSTYKDGEICYVPEDDWVSGFFAGSLWYMYELTGDEYWAEHAERQCQAIEQIQYLKWHHDIGFMIGCSYGNGLRLKDLGGYKDVMINAAQSLSTRFRPTAGVIQSWDIRGWQALRGWECPVIIDNMMNLELLFKATEFTGDSTYADIAISHADKTMANHYRADYSTYHVVDYDLTTGEVRGRYTAQGYSDESAWARGQGWSLYGYLIMYRYTHDAKYLQRAVDVAGFIYSHPNMPEDLVPYWDFDCPDIPNTYRDVSTAAILASALYELYQYTSDETYRARADKTIESLSSPAYRADVGTNGGFILMHSVGSIPHGSSIDVPLNYADYYFLEALVRRSRVDRGEQAVSVQ